VNAPDVEVVEEERPVVVMRRRPAENSEWAYCGAKF